MKELRLKSEESGALCMALAALFRAGICAGDALSLMAQDETDGVLRTLLTELAARADGGEPLSRVFREAGCLPAYACGLLEAGERVGRTEQVLEALAHHYERRARMEKRLYAALFYPAVLLVILLAVVAVLLMWVLPVFDDVYAQMGSRLTGIAGGLLVLGQVLRRVLPAALAVFAAAAVVLALVWKHPASNGKLRRLVRKLSGSSGVLGRLDAARAAQALALGMSSGLTHEESAELAAALTDAQTPLGRRCRDCARSVAAGESLSAALREAQILPPSQCRLLEAGIRSGQGEAVMDAIAVRLLDESEEALESAAGRVEPALVLVTAVLVGAVLLTVMLPLLHILSALG